MKKLSPQEQEAKLSVLKQVMDDMDDRMCGDLDKKKGMKVSVMSDSKKGLEEGLNKAENLMGKFGATENEAGSLMDEDSYDEDSHLEPELEEKDPEQMSSDELDKKIKELMALKEAKQVKAPF